MKRSVAGSILFACGLAACAPASPAFTLTPLASPAAPGSGEPDLSVGADGTVYLSWLEPHASEGHALRFARLAPGSDAWATPSAAAPVVARDDLFVNWADVPSLLPTRSGRLVAHWLQQDGDGPYAYNVMVAQSDDSGESWSVPHVLHDDGVEAEHGFVSLVETPGGEVQAIWLDGRNTTNASPEMALGFATLGPDGVPGATTLIDARICDCCQTSAAWTSTGLAVVYRDRSAEEIRDISIMRHVDGVWTEPVRVHADDWVIEGCPVNGPAIAANGANVAVAWFTGAGGVDKVNVAFSGDGGATFGPAVRVDDGAPAGRVDVALDTEGRALATWLERTEDGKAEIRLRAIAPDGKRSAATVVAETSAARASGFPRMAMAGGDIVLAWTAPGEPSTVQVARARATE